MLINEGMCDQDNYLIKGDLYFIFNIIYPKKISNELKNYLLNSELNLLSKNLKSTKKNKILYLENKIPQNINTKKKIDNENDNIQCNQQ